MKNKYTLAIHGPAALAYARHEWGKECGNTVQIQPGPFPTRELALRQLCRIGEFVGPNPPGQHWGSVHLVNLKTGKSEFVR